MDTTFQDKLLVIICIDSEERLKLHKFFEYYYGEIPRTSVLCEKFHSDKYLSCSCGGMGKATYHNDSDDYTAWCSTCNNLFSGDFKTINRNNAIVIGNYLKDYCKRAYIGPPIKIIDITKYQQYVIPIPKVILTRKKLAEYINDLI